MTRVKAKGDGNCAFNAFALGLCNLIQSKKLDGVGNAELARQQKIIDIFIEKGLVTAQASWDDVKNYLSGLRTKEQLEDLQKALAAYLRALPQRIVNRENSNNAYENTTFPFILRAYTTFVQNPDNKSEDDIFCVHPFIAEEFQQLHTTHKVDINAAQDALTIWWVSAENHGEQSGALKFLAEMSKDGKYAGDLELAYLAKYLGIELDYLKGNATSPVFLYSDKDNYHGEIPLAKFDLGNFSSGSTLIAYLDKESIITVKDKTVILLACHEERLKAALKSFFDARRIKPQPEEIEKITSEIVKLWKEHYQTAATITLRHNGVNHWDYEAEDAAEWLQPLFVDDANLKMKQKWLELEKFKEVLKKVFETGAVSGVDKASVKVVAARDNANSFALQYKRENGKEMSEINVAKKNDEYTLSTADSSDEQLEILVEAVAKLARELNLAPPIMVEIETKNDEVRKKLMEFCRKKGLQVKVNGHISAKPAKQTENNQAEKGNEEIKQPEPNIGEMALVPFIKPKP